MMKSLDSTKGKITQKNGINVPNLEITDVVLVYCKVINNDCQQDSKVFIHLFLIS